jgi:SAM-dependent methyltransferase
MENAEIQLFPDIEKIGLEDEAAPSRPVPERVYERLFPERRFTSFFRRQIRFVFFSILADIITPESVVLDYGAGRGKHIENEYGHMARLASFRGRVKKVIGVDPDDAVFSNPTLDEAFRMDPAGAIPLPDASVDIVFSCAVLEHVSNPEKTASEITRVLKPGGWFCAYTPNKWGYVGMGVRIVPNALHARLLKFANPNGPAAKDVFPTLYRMNTLGDIARLFPNFRNASFIFNGPPGYNFGSVIVARFWMLAMSLMPYRMGQTLFTFVQKK